MRFTRAIERSFRGLSKPPNSCIDHHFITMTVNTLRSRHFNAGESATNLGFGILCMPWNGHFGQNRWDELYGRALPPPFGHLIHILKI